MIRRVLSWLLLGALANVWRAATYRDAATSHPRADAGLDILRRRRPQDELEGWR